MAKKITGSGWSRAEFLEAQGEMAGKPKITLSALKCDAFLNLKRQLASKDKELAKALQDNKMCAEHMNAQDAEIVKLEKENAALTARIAKAKEAWAEYRRPHDWHSEPLNNLSTIERQKKASKALTKALEG